MSKDIVVANEDTLNEIIEELTRFANMLEKNLSDAQKSITSLSEEWDDEDYQNIKYAVDSFSSDVEHIKNLAVQLAAKANNRIEMIHELHKMKLEV